MNFVDSYLYKNRFSPKIKESPANNLGIIIVIPCFNEPDIIHTLQSLYRCDAPTCKTEVIIVINHTQDSDPYIVKRNQDTLDEINAWTISKNSDQLHFFSIFIPDMPTKHAGVGLARKFGMDEAVYRFNSLQKTGIIAGFDADSICDPNYLTEIERHFSQNKITPGASIYFEHPVKTEENLSHLENGIIQYELHLRYLNQCIRYTGHPHAYHTIGSSFAVRSDTYVKQGGMNKRQAGEDFYFLQKIISLGNYSEINTTRVIPSARISDRVPFGTGAAIKKWNDSADDQLITYHFSTFKHIKEFHGLLEIIYQTDTVEIPALLKNLDSALLKYLMQNDYIEQIQSIKQNTTTFLSFKTRFFKWFTVFMIIKYLNLTKEKNEVKQQTIHQATNDLLKQILPGFQLIHKPAELLLLMRKIEKGEITI